jgi:hypothetical protein
VNARLTFPVLAFRMSGIPSINELLAQIEEHIRRDPNNLEPVLTELFALLNKHDPDILNGDRQPYKLVKEGFDADRTLKNIHDLAKSPGLTVPQIRFKADELSRSKRIPLPNSTRKHKEPLMQWFHIHWRELAGDIEKWKGESIPSASGN